MHRVSTSIALSLHTIPALSLHTITAPSPPAGYHERNAATHALMSLLSMAHVTFGDAVGESNKTLLMQLIRADGLLLKADRPATAIDAQFQAMLFNAWPGTITAPSLHHPCTIPAPSLHHPCTITAPSLHHHSTITAPSPHHHCTITDCEEPWESSCADRDLVWCGDGAVAVQ